MHLQNFLGDMPPDPPRMVVPSALPLKLICGVTRLWRNFAPPSEIFCVRHWLRGRCRLTDKLSVLSEPRHARWICSYYLDAETSSVFIARGYLRSNAKNTASISSSTKINLRWPHQNQHRLKKIVKYDLALLFTRNNQTPLEGIVAYTCTAMSNICANHATSTAPRMWYETPFSVHNWPRPTWTKTAARSENNSHGSGMVPTTNSILTQRQE